MNEKVRDLQHFVELYESGRKFCYANDVRADVANWPIDQILEHISEARLYVESNTVMIEIPKPMSEKPERGTLCFYLAPSEVNGFGAIHWVNSVFDNTRFNHGLWRTQEEVEQVIAAMRGAK